MRGPGMERGGTELDRFIMAWFRKEKRAEAAPTVDFDRLPRHIAIIMDGNGRWAKRRGLPRTAGHAAGAETFRTIATYCRDIGLPYLTVYAFSTENWKRPPDEVGTILSLLRKYLLEATEKMIRENMRLRILGNLEPFPPEFRELVEKTNALSEQLHGFQANVCLNYGGRDEILRAADALAAERAAGNGRLSGPLTEEEFSARLDTAGLPDPDLIIRPGGETRLSNFLLWQAAYAELYFTETLWPDFGKEDLNCAIAEFQRRSRRFGGV